MAGLFAAIDAGRFNPLLAQFASSRLGRPVQFRSLQAHLLAADPTVTIDGLKVGNPPWAGPSDLLDADRLRLTLRWPGLNLAAVEVTRPAVTLLRLSRERNNWSSGQGGGGGGAGLLGSLRRLRVTDGRFAYDDRVLDLRLTGTAAYGVGADPARPLVVAATGVIKDGAIQLSAKGGPLEHQPRNAPYPFAAHLQDGATVLDVDGATDKPASLQGFDLKVAAHGPNLADTKYLLGLGLPNSAPFSLTGRVSRKGPTTRATGLSARVGQSDFTGSVVSDGSKARRLITIDLDSQTLYAADVGAFLGHVPDHAATRSVSGAAPKGGKAGPLLTTRPIDVKRFRLRDYRLAVRARRFVVGGLSPGRLAMAGTLDHGRFELKPFSLVFPSGQADGILGIDLTGTDPAFRVDVALRRAAIASLIPALSHTVTGTLDGRVQVAGAGGSWKAVGLDAKGSIGVQVRDGELQAAKADILSGAIVRGAFTALAHKDARTALACALGDFGVGRGQIAARRILLVTDAGTAVADGGVDLHDETIDLTLHGRPSGFRLFTVKAPVSITGPMLRPRAAIRLGGASSPVTAPDAGKDRVAFCNEQAKLSGPFH